MSYYGSLIDFVRQCDWWWLISCADENKVVKTNRCEGSTVQLQEGDDEMARI